MGAEIQPSSILAAQNAVRRSVPAYEFGEFRVDVENRQLLRDGQAAPVTPKVFDTLLFLVEHSGKLVTKDELMSAVWPGTFVSDSNLTQTIFMLRKALGESASEQRYVVTVPGRGYRFAGEIRNQAAEGASTAFTPSRGGWKQVRWAALFVLVLAVASGLYWYTGRSSPRANPQSAAPKAMLAVLPFENMTGDPSHDYFTDGFTDDTTMEAGKLDPQRFGVIAHTSVANYKSGDKPLAQIGRELNVEYVVEGSIRRKGSHLVIDAELIRISDQGRLWSHTYERDLNDVASVPATIVEDVGTVVEGRVASRANAPATVTGNYQSYDLQLKARYSLSRRTTQSLKQAAVYFRQATALDPNNPRAYAGLASTYALMASYRLAPQGEFIPQARAAALKAIALDDQLSEAHTALALIVQNYDYDWKTAEREYLRAIELDPNNATAHHWYAEHLALRGRIAEALAEIDKARQLDPVSLIIAADHATIFYYARRYDEAIRQFRSILDVEPTFSHAYLVFEVYVKAHRLKDAETALARWQQTDDGEWIIEAHGLLDAESGNIKGAESAIPKLRAIDRKTPIDPAAFAGLYAAMGKKDLAFAALEKARQEHSISLTTLKVHPGWDPLRSDPRFNELLKSVNLAD